MHIFKQVTLLISNSGNISRMTAMGILVCAAMAGCGVADASGSGEEVSSILCRDGVRGEIKALSRRDGEAWDCFGRAGCAEPDMAGVLTLRGNFGTLRERMSKRPDSLEVSAPFFEGQSVLVDRQTEIDWRVWDVDLEDDDHVARIRGPAIDLFRRIYTVTDNGQAAVRLECL